MSELDQAPFIEAVRKSRDQATCEAQDAVDSRAKADAQALADVRTLDDWALAGDGRCVELFPGGEGWRYLLKFRVNPINDADEHWCDAAETIPKARAAAAKWVREQKGECP